MGGLFEHLLHTFNAPPFTAARAPVRWDPSITAFAVGLEEPEEGSAFARIVRTLTLQTPQRQGWQVNQTGVHVKGACHCLLVLLQRFVHVWVVAEQAGGHSDGQQRRPLQLREPWVS